MVPRNTRSSSKMAASLGKKHADLPEKWLNSSVKEVKDSLKLHFGMPNCSEHSPFSCSLYEFS
jgi:hypothetical protein